MQSDLLKCQNCSTPFDKESHAPKLLPCGHTVCLACINKMLSLNHLICSSDNETFPVTASDTSDSFKDNLALVAFLEEKGKQEAGLAQKYEICQVHDKKKNLVCMVDRCLVCRYCADYGSHKGHMIKHFNDFDAEVKKKKEQCENLIKDDNACKQAIMGLMKGKRMAVQQIASDTFKASKKLFVEKQKQVHSEIDIFFDKKVKEVTDKLASDAEFKNSLKAKISNLSEVKMVPVCFEALEMQVRSFKTKDEYDRLYQQLEDYEQKMDQSYTTFNTSLGTILQQLTLPSTPEVLVEGPVKMEEELTSETLICSTENMGCHRNQEAQVKEDCFIISLRKNSKNPEELRDLAKNGKLSKIKKLILKFNQLGYFEEFLLLQEIWKDLSQVNHLEMVFSQDHDDESLKKFLATVFWATENLSIFKLSLLGCNVTDTTLINFIKETLPRMKNLKSLSLEFGSTDITDASINEFTQIMPSMTALESIDLQIDETKITDNSIQKLCSADLKCLKNLKRFALGLDKTAITDKSVEALSQAHFVTLTLLDSFELSLYKTQVTNQSVQKLFSSSSHALENITILKLDLGKTKITDLSLEAFANCSASTMMNLVKFELYLDNAKVTDKSLEVFARVMPLALKNLKAFLMNLCFTQITDKSLEVFSEHLLPSMKELEDFQLFLGSTSVSDNGIAQLVTGLDSFAANLKTFSLGLSQTKTSDKGLETLSLSGISCMQTVTTWSLDLANTQVTSKGLESLSDVAKGFKNVKVFALNISNTQMQNQGLKHFAETALPAMTSLENLDLKIYNTEISDTSVEILSQAISEQNKKLRSLFLALDSTKLTDKGLIALSKGVASLSGLKKLKLYVGGTQITNTGVSKFFKNTKTSLVQLKDLALGLNSTPVTDKGLFMFSKDILPSMRELKSFEIHLTNTKVSRDMQTNLTLIVKAL